MEDRIARDGTLARCNANREATLNDIECANARRAASAIALRQERDRIEELERESAQKLEELRRQLAESDRIAQEALAAAEAAELAAYEAQWRDPAQAAPQDRLSFIELPSHLRPAQVNAAPAPAGEPAAPQPFAE